MIYFNHGKILQVGMVKLVLNKGSKFTIDYRQKIVRLKRVKFYTHEIDGDKCSLRLVCGKKPMDT